MLSYVEATVLSEDGHAGRIYTPSGPDLLTYGEVAERLSAGVGTPIPCKSPRPIATGTTCWLRATRMRQ